MCVDGGLGLRGLSGRQAGTSFVGPLAIGRQRLSAIAVLISRGPSCDLQTHGSPVTRVVRSKVFFFY